MKIIIILISASILLIEASCVSIQAYQAKALNIPLLKQKGDFTGTLSTGGISGCDLNGAYAISNSLVALANVYCNNVSTYDLSSNIDSKRDGYFFINKGLSIESGIGYYYTQKDIKCEIIGGFGIGYSKRKFERLAVFIVPLESEGRYQNFFLQFDCGLGDENKALSFGLKFNRIVFPNFEVTGYADYNDGYKTTLRNFSMSYMEPSLTYTRDKKLRFFMQAGISVGLNQIIHLESGSLILRAGLQLKLQKANAVKP